MADSKEPAPVDPRDLQIQQLQAEVQRLTADAAALGKASEKTIDGLQKRLRAATDVKAPASPRDVVYIGDVPHPILGLYRADNTFVEVKRGAVFEGSTLVNIERTH